MKMEQSVPKRRYINSRRRVIIQKKTYNIQNTAKAWNQEDYKYYLMRGFEMYKVLFIVSWKMDIIWWVSTQKA